MMHVIAIFSTLFVGGLPTSYAEHKFNYNLYDLLKDILKKI